MVLGVFKTITGKQMLTSLFIIKLLSKRPATLLKKDSTHVIYCEFCEILRVSFLQDTFCGCFLKQNRSMLLNF